MTTLVLCASAYAWPTTSMDVFGATGLISLLVRPSAVVDPSFWLSYAAVFGLIIAAQAAQLSPSDLLLLDPEKSQSPWQTKLRTLIVSSVGAGFLTLPFSAFYFAEVSLSGLIINLFLVPVAGFLQTPAILLVAIGCASNIPFFSSAAAFCAGVLDAMCMSLDDLLGHTYPMMPLSVFQLLLAFIAAVFLIKIAQARKRICKLSVAFLCIAIAFVPTFFSKRDSLEVTFLPVGQGDAAVIESPTGEVMVIDGGGNHDDTYNPGERIISPFLRRRHIQAIDVVVLSHPDADHLMGLLPLFENFEVKELWHNGFDESHPLMARLLEVARAHHVKLRTPEDFGEKIAFGRATITFISLRALTPQSPKLTSTNNRSLVLKIAFENQSILFPGDIEEIMENEFAKTRQDLSATIIKAPHHGSKSSSSANFVNAANASHVVFCTGINNRFGFPHSQVIKRWQDHGATLWNTAVNGETTFSLSRESVEVRPYIAISEDES